MARKIPISFSVSVELYDKIDELAETSQFNSRTKFLENLVNKAILDECPNCKSVLEYLEGQELKPEYLNVFDLDEVREYNKSNPIRYYTSSRNSEKVLLNIIKTLQDASKDNTKAAHLIDILNEAQSHNIDRNMVEDMIQKMIREGRLMRPNGYEYIQVL